MQRGALIWLEPCNAAPMGLLARPPASEDPSHRPGDFDIVMARRDTGSFVAGRPAGDSRWKGVIMSKLVALLSVVTLGGSAFADPSAMSQLRSEAADAIKISGIELPAKAPVAVQ